MQLFDYVSEIHTLNSHLFVELRASTLASFGFGLIEETLEFIFADENKELEEAGDVLAYVTLLFLAASGGNVVDAAVELENYLSTPVDSNKFAAMSLLGAAGNLKRLFREGQHLNLKLIAGVYSHVEFMANYDLETVAEENIRKLKGRHERGTLFAGTGDR